MDEAQGSEWRVHFHVPVFLAEMEHFSTTQDFLRDILALHRERPISGHLEVETYTWDVLPERYRGVPVATAIARELNWVKSQLDRMTFAVALKLGRVSNLPTVWTNALAGLVLGGRHARAPARSCSCSSPSRSPMSAACS